MFGWGLRLGNGGYASASYDSSSIALFDRFTAPPTTSRKIAINNLIIALKSAGVWEKLDALHVMAAADSQAARQNWIANTYNLTAVSGPTFTADRGYQGDGVASHLTSGFNPATASSPKFILNSAHVGVWSRTDLLSGTAYDLGNGDARINSRSNNGNSIRGLVNTNTFSTYGSVANSLGHSIINRSASNAQQSYRDGVSVGSNTVASTAVLSAAFTVCRGGSDYSARQLSVSHWGQSLNSTEAADLYSAISTYLTAVGAL